MPFILQVTTNQSKEEPSWSEALLGFGGGGDGSFLILRSEKITKLKRDLKIKRTKTVCSKSWKITIERGVPRH